MTKDEALKILKECREKEFKYTFYTLGAYHTALDMAIKALEQAPSNPEKDRKESQDYCAECDHIEMCAWYPTDGCVWLKTDRYNAGYNDAKREIALSGEYERAYQRGFEAGKALEQESCEDAISRQAVLKIIDSWYDHNRDTSNVEDLIILITYMNPVNSQEPQAESEES